MVSSGGGLNQKQMVVFKHKHDFFHHEIFIKLVDFVE